MRGAVPSSNDARDPELPVLRQVVPGCPRVASDDVDRTRHTPAHARRTRHWSQLGPGQRAAILAAGALEVALAASAWVDLARRPAERVNGPKALWAGVICVNVAGPLAYFRWGRRD